MFKSRFFRVLKTGGSVTATLNIDMLKESAASGFMKYANFDPLNYMSIMEAEGFSNVGITYHEHEHGFKYQVGHFV